MHYKTHVIFINTHPKRIGSNKDLIVSHYPAFLAAVLVFHRQTRMEVIHILYVIPVQKLREFFAFFPGSYVDYPRLRVIFKQIQNALVFV